MMASSPCLYPVATFAQPRPGDDVFSKGLSLAAELAKDRELRNPLPPRSERAMKEPLNFAMTVEHLFAEVWSREAISDRDRRLLLVGLLVGQGLDEAVEVQLETALRTGDLSAEE